MSKDVRGRFYFKRTTNANLIGEFSNDKNDGVFTESSDLQDGGDDFTGTYNSTWQEKGTACFAKLVVKRIGKLFSLQWTDDKGKPSFTGAGMRCDDILIGDYRSGP